MNVTVGTPGISMVEPDSWVQEATAGDGIGAIRFGNPFGLGNDSASVTRAIVETNGYYFQLPGFSSACSDEQSFVSQGHLPDLVIVSILAVSKAFLWLAWTITFTLKARESRLNLRTE